MEDGEASNDSVHTASSKKARVEDSAKEPNDDTNLPGLAQRWTFYNMWDVEPTQTSFLDALGHGPEPHRLRLLSKATKKDLDLLQDPAPCPWVKLQVLSTAETFGRHTTDTYPHVPLHSYACTGPVLRPPFVMRSYQDSVCHPPMSVQTVLLAVHDLLLSVFYHLYEAEPALDARATTHHRFGCSACLVMGTVWGTRYHENPLEIVRLYRNGQDLSVPIPKDIQALGVRGICIDPLQAFQLTPHPHHSIRQIGVKIDFEHDPYFEGAFIEQDNGTLQIFPHAESWTIPPRGWQRIEEVLRQLFHGAHPRTWLFMSMISQEEPADVDAHPGRFYCEQHRPLVDRSVASCMGAYVSLQIAHEL